MILSAQSPKPAPIRVFLCDDVDAFRFLMRSLLEEDPDIRIVGEACDGHEGVRGVAEHRPDVVLLDLSMPILDGMEAIPLMHAIAPEVRIITLSGFSADRMAPQVLGLGACGYIEKGEDVEVIRRAIRVAAGRAERVAA